MPNVTWTMKHYDRNGNPIVSADYGHDIQASSNILRRAVNRNMVFPLNGIDELNFSLYLDDPAALNVQPLTSFVKVWRNGPGYADSGSFPCFGGIVTQKVMRAEAGIVDYKVYSPLWRLQSRFHLHNWYLVINEDTGSEYTTSELMWYLIELVNNAFDHDVSFTGIKQGSFSWGDDPIAVPYFVPRGSNTWTHIFDDLMSRDGSPDILPVYVHTDGSDHIMRFSTMEKRGAGGFGFYYRVGESNSDDVTETQIVVPGEFANYLWVVGQGGPNSGKVAKAEDDSYGGYGYNSIGMYMRRIDSQMKRYNATMKRLANAELKQSKVPKTSYEVTVAPGGPLMYGRDYNVGDICGLFAQKGAMQIAKLQRVYQVTLSNSEANMETSMPLIADDFYADKSATYA